MENIEITQYYINSIKIAVEKGNINKAQALSDEAKSLRIPYIQEYFIKKLNRTYNLSIYPSLK